jgi:hypothetical protein
MKLIPESLGVNALERAKRTSSSEPPEKKKTRLADDFYIEPKPGRNDVQNSRLKEPKGYYLRLQDKKPQQEKMDDGIFGLDARDRLSDKSIIKMMRSSLAVNYPYMYAVGTLSKGDEKLKCLLDGAAVYSLVFDHDNFVDGANFEIETEKKSITVATIELYCHRNFNENPARIGNLIDLQKKGYSEPVIAYFLAGSEDLDDVKNLNISRVIASCFLAIGEFFSADPVFAKKVISGLKQGEIDAAVAESLAMVACTDLPHLVRPLLAMGGGVDELARESKYTPLMLALYGGHIEVARELIAAGADVNKEIKGISPANIAKDQGLEALLLI